MKKSFALFAFLYTLVIGVSQNIFAQNEPVLYFCEKYDSNGEIGISSRFTTGYLTVMVKCDYALDLEDCSIQFDLYNPRTKKFEYYKKFDYVVDPTMKYIFFAKNDVSDLKVEDPGLYRVFLLDNRDKTIASALIEISQSDYYTETDNIKSILPTNLVEKKSIIPPNLSVSLEFLDTNDNRFLDAGERGKISLFVKNDGPGSAYGVKFDLQMDKEDYYLTYPKTAFVGDITPNSTKQTDIEISASKSVQKLSHTIILKGYESNGFGPPDAKISFETFPLLPPEFSLVDYGITSNRSDNIIRTGEISNLKIRFQNVGQGLAQNTSMTILLPKNVFFTPDSKSSVNFKTIGRGEFVDLDLSIVPNKLVANEIQINFNIKEENTETNIPLNLPINKQLASIQELVVKGKEKDIEIKDVADLSSDIEKNIPVSSIKNNNAIAIVIGISDYQNGNVPKVVYARRDASLIRQYLEKYFGYDIKNILPRNEDELMTSGTIKNYIKNVIPSYLKKDGSSELFVYYTGHGAPSTITRNAYFVPYDCDPNYVGDINAYNMNEFYSDIAKLNAKKKIVVIDACFSGQSGDGNMLIKDASPIYVTMENEMNLDDKSIMFLSSGVDQVSNWYPEKKHSMFTYFFLKGLQGNADINKDGSISVSELENYINDENNGLPYYSNREYQRPQKAIIHGQNPLMLLK